ncbi:ATP-binding cassette domain-containing protein [Halovulum sp. GXIMD14793]
MAEPPLLTLSDIALSFGGNPLFTDISLAVQPGDRLCLVGRNGSGKSTVLKIIAGLVEADDGTRFVQPGRAVAYMEQDPDFSGFASLRDFVVNGLPEAETYRADIALEGVQLNGELAPDAASGGERRRAALAKLIASDADLLLIDEPTNHLDIRVIDWLEGHLRQTRQAFVLISHDRAFLRALSRATLWLDRGVLRRMEKGFDAFEAWRDKVFEEENQERHKLNRLIKAEARWAVEGISARRKRNMGRVRRLQDLRAERAAQIRRTGVGAMALETATTSGKLVVEAEEISKTYGDRTVVRDFSLKIQRGDRVALIGPNGAGKTTLLKMLTDELAPDTGRVRLGTKLQPVVFDQNRAAINGDISLWDALVLDPDLAASGRSDQIMVRGAPRHVVGYLKDFLFSDQQARGPVSALSGGEKARLLLAKLMAKDSNFLILDEPTNDLDIETLDLLQELIDDYPGTVLLVSHDRDFIDRVATTTIAMDGQGGAVVYAGGYSDCLSQRGSQADAAERPAGKSAKKPEKTATKPKAQASGLSFTQKHRLEALPAEMDQLSADIAKLETLLADPDLFTRDPAKFQKATDALVQRQEKLMAAEEEWLELESLREAGD